MKIDARRNVDHKIILVLEEEDYFDGRNERGYGQNRNKPMRVEFVRWPGPEWNTDQSVMNDDTNVTLAGSLYRKDGTLGVQRGLQTMRVGHLPEQLREAMTKTHAEVYAP